MTQRKVRPPPEFVRRDTQFQTREELDSYLNADKIVCLLCGLRFTRLAPHLLQKHDVAADAYKIQYGIPFHRGLTTPQNREASSTKMLSMYAEGKIRAPSALELRLRSQDLPPRRARAKFLLDEDIQKLITSRGGKPLWTRGHYEEFIRRVVSGRPVQSVGMDSDVPGWTATKRYLAKHEDLRQVYEKAIAEMPPHLQVQARRTGPAVREAVMAMRKEGLLWREISEKTGIKLSTLLNFGNPKPRRSKLG